MKLNTTRFGTVRIESDDILLFPTGLIGLEEQRHWVLLADADNEAVGWLQNVNQPEVALPVVSPRRFAPDYQVRVDRRQLQPLELSEADRTFVLVVLAKNDDQLTLNLKAPIIVNLDRRLGRQVVTTDEQPMQMVLASAPLALRKSA